MFKKSFFILKHRDTETQSKYEGAIDQQKLCISVSLCSINKNYSRAAMAASKSLICAERLTRVLLLSMRKNSGRA